MSRELILKTEFVPPEDQYGFIRMPLVLSIQCSLSFSVNDEHYFGMAASSNFYFIRRYLDRNHDCWGKLGNPWSSTMKTRGTAHVVCQEMFLHTVLRQTVSSDGVKPGEEFMRAQFPDTEKCSHVGAVPKKKKRKKKMLWTFCSGTNFAPWSIIGAAYRLETFRYRSRAPTTIRREAKSCCLFQLKGQGYSFEMEWSLWYA